ncbi:hypothetical protein ACIP88_26010 [Streptomyces uncialis]|uniref:hypothetical protein n=1 Tax=Streptomyces uncialis TaxID=1048205 RepID=UPI0037F81ECC
MSKRMCGATARLPLELIVLALDITPEMPGHPMEVATGLRCPLEAHTTGQHHELVRELGVPERGEVWARWSDGQVPDGLDVLADCPADNGLQGPDHDICTLYTGHPGGHSWEFPDPEYEAIVHSSAYERLQAEVDRYLGRDRNTTDDRTVPTSGTAASAHGSPTE